MKFLTTYGAATDVVDRSRATTLEHLKNPSTVVVDEEPVSNVLSVAVERDLDAVKEIRDKERNKFFGKLARTVVVRAARHHDVQSVRALVRQRRQVRAGLARRVRRVRFEEVVLAPGTFVDRPVDLVGGDVYEALDARSTRALE